MPENNKVKYGLENVHISKITEDAEGNITYGTPFAIPGVVKLSANPVGEMSPFYADNIKYFVSTSNNGYEGELEVAIIPEQMLKDIFGQEQDDNGAIIENANDVISRFALMGEIKGDAKNRRFVYYDCMATRTKQEDKTLEDKKTPQTDVMPIVMSPRKSDQTVKAVLTLSETNSAAYNNFYTAVYEKDQEISG